MEGGVFLETFFYEEAQGHTCLTCSRRSHKEEIILRLHRFFHHFIVVGVVAMRQVTGGITTWCPLCQQELTHTVRSAEERVETVYGGGGHSVAAGMFDGPRREPPPNLPRLGEGR